MCLGTPGFSLLKPVHPLIGIFKIAPFFWSCWQLLETKCGQIEPFSASLVRAGVSKAIHLPCPAPARLGSVTPEPQDKKMLQSYIAFSCLFSQCVPSPSLLPASPRSWGRCRESCRLEGPRALTLCRLEQRLLCLSLCQGAAFLLGF